MSPNQLAFVRRQTVQVAAVAADVEPIISDDRTGPETILFFGLLIQSAFSLISPNEFSRFLFVAADNSIFGGRVNKAIEDRKSTRLNSSHEWISYAVFCLKKKSITHEQLISPTEISLLVANVATTQRRSITTHDYPTGCVSEITLEQAGTSVRVTVRLLTP